jgi:branched-chain amino acid transport system ATP-binding protein
MSILKLVDVTKSFGGLKAVRNLSLEVNEGDILGLIGPNGAGKTTVFNLITGFLQPENGEIIFDGHSLLELKPHAICKLGITRSFQIAKPFSALTVLQSVMVGAFHLTKEADHAKTEALKILDSLRLTHLVDMKTRSLTLSDRKRVEIARAIATQPKLLLLDEAMAGMNLIEVEDMLSDIRKIHENGITLVVIEHVMKAVMSLSGRVIVLNHGEKIAEGTPEEVSNNQDVIKAYLGEEYLVS